jgi:hypothetical protein
MQTWNPGRVIADAIRSRAQTATWSEKKWKQAWMLTEPS